MGFGVQQAMAILPETMVAASKTIEDDRASQPTRKETNGVDHGLPSPLETFAQDAMNSVTAISNFFRSKHLPHPSLARDTPTNAFLSAPDEVHTERSKLTEAALRLLHLAQGPQEYIPNLAVNVSSSF